MSLVICVALLLAASNAIVLKSAFRTTTGEGEVKCRMTPKYPPPANHTLPLEIVNLDLPANQRWTAIVTPRAQGIRNLINAVFDKLPANLTAKILDFIDKDGDAILSRFPEDYGQEIQGIADAIGIDVGLIVIYNIFYEISSVCTSIVAQDLRGNVYHARNLDFGLFMGWDWNNGSWAVTDLLRPLLFQAEFQSGGVVVYNATQYAGYVGILTGFKKGAFSVTVDTRLDNEIDIPLVEWFEGKYDGNFVGFLNRQVLATNATYADAFNTFNTFKTIAPVYLILGGTSAGEGAVITREYDAVINVWLLSAALANGSWFLLETNYAHWKEPPFFDNRAGPGILCMQQLGQADVGFPGLFNVLSGKPNLNDLTTYTALMNVATGEVQSFLQICPKPCSLW